MRPPIGKAPEPVIQPVSGSGDSEMRDSETRAGWPTGYSMVVQLREALGLFAGAMPIPAQAAWDEALAEVRRLREVAERR
jgi:hypothetical protein